MLVVGLTGSIATGKSTVVGWLKELGLQVHDADACVHHMFKQDTKVINAIRNLWPECVGDNGVDRTCLREKVMNDQTAIKQLEAITHPVVRKMNQDFLRERKLAGDSAVFLDIPLLFEGGSEKNYDCTLVVYCSPETQKQRALARGANPELFDLLLSKQMPLAEKIEKADFTLNSDGTLAETRQKLIEVLHQIEKKFNINIIRNSDA